MLCGPCDPDHASLFTHQYWNPSLGSVLFVPWASLVEYDGLAQLLGGGVGVIVRGAAVVGVVVRGGAVVVMVRAGALVVVVVVGGRVVVVVVVGGFGFVVVGDDFAAFAFVAPFSVGADPQLATTNAAIDTPMATEIGLMENNCNHAPAHRSQRRWARPFGRKASSSSPVDVGRIHLEGQLSSTSSLIDRPVS